MWHAKRRTDTVLGIMKPTIRRTEKKLFSMRTKGTRPAFLLGLVILSILLGGCGRELTKRDLMGEQKRNPLPPPKDQYEQLLRRQLEETPPAVEQWFKEREYF